MARKDNLLKNLPDFYDTSEQSNNNTLMTAFGRTMDSVDINISALQTSIQISTAIGQQLDDIGALFDITRDGRTDEQFRSVILGFWSSILGGGTKTSIKTVIQNVFGFPLDDISINEINDATFTIELIIDDTNDITFIYDNVFSNVNNVKASGTFLVDVLFNSKNNVFLTNFSEINGGNLLL